MLAFRNSKLHFLDLKTFKVRYFCSRIPPPEGREALCLPNLLAGGLPAGLALAADKRAQHTRATQKSTTRAPHKRAQHTHAWIYTGDITAAIEMGGAAPCRPHLYRFFHIFSRVCIHASLFVWRACVSLCVARVCCALLCGARVLCSFVSCKRQTCRQAPSQDIRQAHIRFPKS